MMNKLSPKQSNGAQQGEVYRPSKKRIDGHTVLVYSLLFVGAFLLLIPFYWMLSNSLKTEAEAQETTTDIAAVGIVYR